jgi:hypothetical protein
MKTMSSPFTLAGTTCDGVPCYFGKKEADDFNSEDLTFWFAVGKPKKDGSNYIRAAWTGFDEEILFAVDYDAFKEPREARKAARENYFLTLADTIAEFTSADLLRIIKNQTA